ncbi:MAG: hypothetical protein Q8N77_05005 [Nanoarchaeota archaeon]|nr:hypothetical protein [Nanoarchaeota archaeon]
MAKGYSGKSGSPSSGTYGLGKGLGGIKGYSPQGKGSGMVYMVVGIGYAGNPKEMAQGLQQYLPILGQYLGKMSERYGKMPQRYSDDSTSLKGFFKPYNANMGGIGICEICRAPVPEGIKRCPTCVSISEGH